MTPYEFTSDAERECYLSRHLRDTLPFKPGDYVQFINPDDDCQRTNPLHTYKVADATLSGRVSFGPEPCNFYWNYRFRPTPTPPAFGKLESLPPPPALSRQSDPTTSQEAAQAVNVTYLEGRVLAGIKALPEGATQDTLVASLKLPSNSITPRFKPLLAKGLIYVSGTRKGASGKNQQVMRAYSDKAVNVAESFSAILRDVEVQRLKREAREQVDKLLEEAECILQRAENITLQFNLGPRIVPSDTTSKGVRS